MNRSTDDRRILGGQEVIDAGLPDWRMLRETIQARFETDGYGTSVALVNRIAELAQEADHHPDIDLRWGWVGVRLWSHDVHGVTKRDVDLARRISEVAAAVGATPAPHKVQLVELGIDTADHERIAPFWRALMGLVPNPLMEDGHDLIDPDGVLPAVWFQQSEERDGVDRAHVDVCVPHDVAPDRVAAAIAAGGRLVTDEFAPAWWVVADPDGNLACVCTWQESSTD